MSTGKVDFIDAGRGILARSLRDYRLRRNMSQKDLAEASGLTQATISEIETGKGNPTFEVICKLATALSIPPFALIGAGAALGVLGTVMAAKSVGEIVGKLVAKSSNAAVDQWIIGELVELAKASLARVEARNSVLAESKDPGKES